MVNLNKKANVADIVLHPLFVVGVALGIVLLIVLRSVYSIGSSEDFEKRFDSAELALTTDSLYAVRPDVAVSIELTPKFQGLISKNKVTVFKKSKEDGKSFFFTEDSAYKFNYGSWIIPKIKLFKTGNEIGIGNTDLLKPYCEPTNKEFNLIVNEFAFQQGEWATDINGNPAIRGTINQGEPSLKIFVNKNKDSKVLACRIAQAMFTKLQIKGFAMLPISDNLAEEDPKREITKNSEPGMFIELTTPNEDLAAVYTSIKRGVEGG